MLKRKRFWYVSGFLTCILVVASVFTYQEAYNCNIRQQQWQHYCSGAKRFAIAVDWILELKPEAWTAFFTFTLFISTTGLWIITARLRRDGDKQRRDTRRAIFASIQAARAARNSGNVARDEFLIAHRPHFVIHKISLLDFANETPPDEQPLVAEFGIINAGESVGIIRSNAVFLTCAYPDDAPWESRTSYNNVITCGPYKVGGADIVNVSGDYLSGGNFLAREETGKKLYLYGWLIYENEKLEGRRTTYFCRIYSDSLKRFTPIEDPEANQTY